MNKIICKIAILIAAIIGVFVLSCDRLEDNHSPVEPFNPYPEDGAVIYEASVNLQWSCSDPDNDNIAYDIYFGISEDVSGGVLATSLNDSQIVRNDLEIGVTYYWRVVAVDDLNNVTIGPLWSFSVEEPSPELVWNPYPEPNSVENGTNTILSWECPFDSSEGVTYELYFSSNAAPELLDSIFTASEYNPDWEFQAEAINTLARIYAGQKEFYSIHGTYCGQGITASQCAPEGFLSFGVEIIPPAFYTYTITTANTELLLVTANSSTYPDYDCPPDTWHMNQNGEFVNTSCDLDVGFEQETDFYWKVLAINSANDSIESPIWRFETIPIEVDSELIVFPGIPNNPFPANNESEVDLVELSWDLHNQTASFAVFDLYFGTTPDPPLIASGLNQPTYEVGYLEQGTTYYWSVIARNPHYDVPGLVWSFTTTDNYAPEIFINFENGRVYGRNSGISWTTYDRENDDVVFDVYFGANENPELVAWNIPDSIYLHPWIDQYEAHVNLIEIYKRQLLYRNANGVYWGEGQSASALEPDNFADLGISIDSVAKYEYTIQIANDTDLIILASANFDPDSDLDIWQIDRACFIQCLSNDRNMPTYEKDQQFYLKIVARDIHGNTSETEIYELNTGGDSPVAALEDIYPEWSVTNIPADNPTLSWMSYDIDGDSVVYDVHFDTTYFIAVVSFGQAQHWYNPGLLLPDQFYWWIVRARNPSSSKYATFRYSYYFWTASN